MPRNIEDFESIFEEVELSHSVQGSSALKIHTKADHLSVKKKKPEEPVQIYKLDEDYIRERRKKEIITLTPRQMAIRQRRLQRRTERNSTENHSKNKKVISIEKQMREAQKAREKAEKAEKKRIYKLSKTIEKNVAKITRKEDKEREKLAKKRAKEEEQKAEQELRKRITPPRKRNILSRFHNMRKYNRGDFEYEEEDVRAYKAGELSREDIEDEWVEIQKYEDARDDVKLRKGWTRFKVTLAALALVGSLFACKTVIDEVKDTFDSLRPESQVTSIMELDQDQRADIEVQSLLFQSDVAKRDGYTFDYLSKQEIAEGYFKLVNYEKNMLESQFNGAMLSMKDQEFLDRIVQKTYGDEVYSTFSPEQQRDYRQLAFETLFVSQPEHFNEDSIDYIRNPIIIDYINARDSAEEKGYDMKLTVNNGEKETVRNLGTLLHVSHTTTVSDVINAGLEDGGKSFLEKRVMDIVGDAYEELDKNEQRTYLQLAYEMLPDNIKGNYFKDPIAIEREAEQSNTNENYER